MYGKFLLRTSRISIVLYITEGFAGNPSIYWELGKKYIKYKL